MLTLTHSDTNLIINWHFTYVLKFVAEMLEKHWWQRFLLKNLGYKSQVRVFKIFLAKRFWCSFEVLENLQFLIFQNFKLNRKKCILLRKNKNNCFPSYLNFFWCEARNKLNLYLNDIYKHNIKGQTLVTCSNFSNQLE